MSGLLINNNIQERYLIKNKKKILLNKFTKSSKSLFLDIDDQDKTPNVLSKNYRFNFKTNDLNSFKKYNSIAIIGIGGSILGYEAIYNFLQKKSKKKIYFFNNLDLKKITSFKKKEKLEKILFIVISKSGNTIETLSNFFSLNILKRNSKNIIIISEKKNNSLYKISTQFNLFYIEHKPNIGGRFSVLSEVGIVPAYLMGIDIKKIRLNTLEYLKKKNQFILRDSVIKLASLLYAKKIKNIVFLNYVPELEKFLFWCQQLLAESLGKNKKGFLPIVSNVPKDHHSLLQLYLDGPNDKIFYIFSDQNKNNEKAIVPQGLESVNFIKNTKLHEIKKTQKSALTKIFKKKYIPFREFKINFNNEETIGELFSYFILETILVAKLTNINPYDQPAVEQVKRLTKKLLTKNTKKYF
tara:strand:- start:651 stop:1883 length:1233 start_codon:yes stop_codon:yes gene_type:complete